MVNLVLFASRNVPLYSTSCWLIQRSCSERLVSNHIGSASQYRQELPNGVGPPIPGYSLLNPRSYPRRVIVMVLFFLTIAIPYNTGWNRTASLHDSSSDSIPLQPGVTFDSESHYRIEWTSFQTAKEGTGASIWLKLWRMHSSRTTGIEHDILEMTLMPMSVYQKSELGSLRG